MPPKRQRKRCKTYTTMMCLNNQLLQSGFGSLASLLPERDEAGKLVNPMAWKHLNISSDMGPDQICMIGFLIYAKLLNVNEDFDGSHTGHNAS